MLYTGMCMILFIGCTCRIGNPGQIVSTPSIESMHQVLA